jgi:putative lipoic acid-binding regulatory protein
MADEPAKLSPEQERGRALALLEATHQFPVLYELSVITFSTPEIFAAVRVAAGFETPIAKDDGTHHMVPSKGGKYTSHRLKVHCATAEDVLELYARLRAVDGVVTLL